MTKLSVNINKVATIRNTRNGNVPDIILFAKKSLSYGADGITVHPRPDERHIRYSDIFALSTQFKAELNIEGNPQVSKFVELVKLAKPQQVTLVPDADNQLTSNHGWDCKKNLTFLKEIISEFSSLGIRTSIFINPEVAQIEFAAKTGTDRIELYTEDYAVQYKTNPIQAIKPYIDTAQEAKKNHLEINAGHDLNLENLHFFKKNIPFLSEVSIGHALIADSLYLGLEKTIKSYKKKLGDEEVSN